MPGGLAVDGLGLNVDGTETRVAEFASGVGGLHTAGGEIPFTDVDLTDGHTVGAVAQAGGYVGVFNAQINAGDEATGGNTGVISWTFEVAETAIDSLAAGESLTQVYTVTVDDGNGGTDSQDVTITITGTNDAPVITDGPVAVTYAEAVDVAGATGQGVLTGGSLTGSLAFNDVDVTDTQTFRVVSATQTSGEIGGYTKSAFEAAALALMSVAGSVSSTGATTGGSINWAFTASDDFFDYLKTGETVEIEYVVEVSDGKGGTATQTITVTVNGANDVLFTDNGETVDLSNAGGLPPQTRRTATISTPWMAMISCDAAECRRCSGGRIWPGQGVQCRQRQRRRQWRRHGRHHQWRRRLGPDLRQWRQ